MKKLGFGCMRLPMIGGPAGTVDQEQFNAMVDAYLDAGFCYFDTAHVYISGQSETALREGLVKRHPREQFILTDKLSGSQFQKEEQILPFFEMQLEACGTAYFDYYLMHSLDGETYEKFLGCNAFEIVRELKRQGRVRHWGISFHDKPEVLRRILTEQPDIEVVQIQYNYIDHDDQSIQSGAVHAVCREFGKPVIIMEPVKGGGLADLPEEASEILRALGGGSDASYAVRYAASAEGVMMVLSGMSTIGQMEDNISYMKDFRPLDDREYEAIGQVVEILRRQNTVPCTGCRYCVAGCPRHILIPDLFACYNTQMRYHDWNSAFYYDVNLQNGGSPADCIRCRKCERICPQHLPITDLLPKVAEAFKEQ